MTGYPVRTPAMVAGVMSGTSLDGVDVAIAAIEGTGHAAQVVQKGFTTTPYSPPLRALLMEAATRETFSVLALSQLNVRLAHEYAQCIRAAMRQSEVATLDLVGSHGQTIRHVPEARECAGAVVTSTFQIGDPSTLANLLNLPVVGDFRMADMALGGQGAPLVPYYEYVTLRSAHRARGLLNIGGIANLTVLPAGCVAEEVYAFDTGCGNMVIDALAEQLLDVPMDRGGAQAAQGSPVRGAVEMLMQDGFFQLPPPKSTGRERYGPVYVDWFKSLCEGRSAADMLATATALTASSIYRAYEDFVAPRHQVKELIVSGGGCHNRTLMHMLSEHFAPIPVVPSEAVGIDSDAKEALCFALLAHETMATNPTGMPGVTGARASAVQGKICLPALRCEDPR